MVECCINRLNVFQFNGNSTSYSKYGYYAFSLRKSAINKISIGFEKCLRSISNFKRHMHMYIIRWRLLTTFSSFGSAKVMAWSERRRRKRRTAHEREEQVAPANVNTNIKKTREAGRECKKRRVFANEWNNVNILSLGRYIACVHPTQMYWKHIY